MMKRSSRGVSVRFSSRAGAVYVSVPVSSIGCLRNATDFTSLKRTVPGPFFASSAINRGSSSGGSAARPAGANAARSKLRRRSVLPEVIEVEPVVRRRAAMALEALDVPREQLRGLRFAAVGGRIGQELEVDVVAAVAPMDAEHRQHWAAQRGRQSKRPDGERRGAAEELPYRHVVPADPAIGEAADPSAF